MFSKFLLTSAYIIFILLTANFLTAANINKIKAKLNKNKTFLYLKSLKAIASTNTKLSLSDVQVDNINDFAKKVTKYFRNQIPPTDRTAPWTDPLFLPTFNSIAAKNPDGTPTDPHKPNSTKIKESEVEWKRPKDIFEGANYTLFETNVSIDDIKQGSLGNCYFLAAISSLAETPQLVLQLFRSMKVSEAGIYEVILRIDGEWQIVLVDDYIPVTKGTNNPLFAKPVNPEIWVLILEKAWAKVNGGYANIDGGSPTEVFNYFTNFPAKDFTHSKQTNKDDFWITLFKSSNNNDIVNCATPGGDDTKNVNGIVSGHAFSLLKAIEIIVNGTKVKLLRIRNPWGNFEWTGKWSDSSPEWNATTKALVPDHEVKDDGTFYIEYSDYLVHFSETYINYFSPLYIAKTYNVPAEIADQGIVTEFVLSKPTNISIMLTTPKRRSNRQIKDEDIQANMILAQKQQTQSLDNPETYFKFITSGNKGSDIIINQLAPGSYVIYSHVNLKSSLELLEFDKAYPYTIQVSGSEMFDFAPRSVDSDHSLARLAIINLEKSRPEVMNNNEYLTVKQTSVDNTSLGFIMKLNGSTTDVNSSFQNTSTNMRLLYPTVFGINTRIRPGRSFITFGPRHKQYESYLTNVSEETSVTTGQEITYQNAQNLFTNATPDIYQLYSEGFIFRYLTNTNLSDLYKTVDIVKAAVDHYTVKYPDLMNYLKDLPNLSDGIKVKFFDKENVGTEGDFIFTEKRLDNGQAHGRTVYKWASGDIFVGYSKNGKFDGAATMITANGVRNSVLYKDGNLVSNL